MNVLLSILFILVAVFIVSSLVGLLQARRDIRKNKNEDNKFRKSRKDIINEKLNADTDSDSGADVLSRIANLSPQEQELFKSELLKKFNEGSVK